MVETLEQMGEKIDAWSIVNSESMKSILSTIERNVQHFVH